METLDEIRQHGWEAPRDPRQWLEPSKQAKSRNKISPDVFEFFHHKRTDELHPVEVRRVLQQGFKVSPGTPSIRTIRLPSGIIIFYVLGFAFTLVFAALLALSAGGLAIVHPLLSLVGLVGGLTWLSTAWTDLVLWKREKLSVEQSARETETAKTASGC